MVVKGNHPLSVFNYRTATDVQLLASIFHALPKREQGEWKRAMQEKTSYLRLRHHSNLKRLFKAILVTKRATDETHVGLAQATRFDKKLQAQVTSFPSFRTKLLANESMKLALKKSMILNAQTVTFLEIYGAQEVVRAAKRESVDALLLSLIHI